MQNFKKFVLIALVFSGTALADNATKTTKDAVADELITKLIKATRMTDMFEQILMSTVHRNLSEDEQVQANIVSTRMNEFFDSPVFIGHVKSVYTKHFTTSELQQLVDFYNSAVGKKVLDVTPQIGVDLFSAINSDMQALMANINDELSKLQPAAVAAEPVVAVLQ